jgi:NAD(P)-dependent dehydrogenase (short-subunit alcohol dehydrogenase family)
VSSDSTGQSARHAVVTGGGSGIGKAVAAALANAGERVTIMGRNAQKLHEAAAGIGALDCAADVTDANSVSEALERAVAANGRVDILVNNAGAVKTAPFERVGRDMWDSVLAVNLTGVYICTQAVIRSMKDAGYGRIVNIASTASLAGYAYVSAYCAAKHGVLGLTRALALETAGKGVTVNAVCPGYTDTELVSSSIERIVEKTGRPYDDVLAEMVSANPQRRLIQPEEVAQAVMWLCGPNSDAITGQAIAVAGGEIM